MRRAKVLVDDEEPKIPETITLYLGVMATRCFQAASGEAALKASRRLSLRGVARLQPRSRFRFRFKRPRVYAGDAQAVT